MNKLSRREFARRSVMVAAGLSTAMNGFGEGLPGGSTELPFASRANPVSKENMKISVFSKHLQWLNYTDMAAFAASIGFDGVDLTVRPGGHVLPEKVKDDLPKAVEAVQKSGLKVYMLTTEITDPSHPTTEAILQTASKLGISHYRMGWLKYKEAVPITQQIESYKASLKELAALNKKYKIHGEYQNHSGANLGSAVVDLWMILKEINSEWLGCQYDIRHATVEGAYSWPVGFNLIQPHIRSLDIKDFQWTKKADKWTLENVPLGTGMVDYPKYFSLLKQHKIDAPISLHFEYPIGGAEHGATTITIAKEEVMEAMKSDLTTLRTWLKESGLS